MREEGQPLRGLRPQGTPPELRRRVLDAAWRVQPEPFGLIERLWYDARLRLAAAAAFTLLIVAHLAIDSGAPFRARGGNGEDPPLPVYEGLTVEPSRRTLEQQWEDLGGTLPDVYGLTGLVKEEG